VLGSSMPGSRGSSQIRGVAGYRSHREGVA
jgi:hypothetical protein